MYKLVPSSEPSDRDNSVDLNREKPYVVTGSLVSKHKYRLCFLLSLFANAAFVVIFLLRFTPSQEIHERSRFAGLTRTIPKQWTANHAGNDTAWDELWDQHTSYDAGVLAFDDAYAKAMGLPRSQRWPWDDHKGIYLINGYHNLHCLKNLRSSLTEYRLSQPQSIPWPHVQHCLLVLRDEIMCDADDTPRYSGFQPSSSTGLGQVRMCRDWNALEKWAMDEERSGCWRDIPGEDGVDGFRELERYRFCPEGSPYEEMSKTAWIDDEKV